jgi:hypothetical protein
MGKHRDDAPKEAPKKAEKVTKSDTDSNASRASRLRVIRDVPKHIDPPKYDGSHRSK